MPTVDRSMSKVQPGKVAPRGEKGSLTGIPLNSLVSWAALGANSIGNDLEYVPDLQWPNSVFTYQKMRNDSQADGLLRGAILPITRWTHALDPNNADPVAVREFSRDSGLPIAERSGDTWKVIEQPIARSQGRFDFNEHQQEALLGLAYGVNFFEQVADLVVPPDDWSVDVPLRARLRKVAARPPWTLTAIETDQDGGLKAIKQLSTPYGDPGITVDRLVAYPWGKEGANWTGRSLFRSCYRPWLIKDRIMRVGAINIERNGAGVPIITAPPGATNAQIKILEDLATRVRAGDSSGGAIPYGATLNLMGVLGSQPDAVGFMKFLNEEMGRGFLEMFLNAGQTGMGTRNTAETHLDFFTWTLEAIADWFCSIFNKIIIERWMAWNFGEPDDPNVDQYAPRLIYIKSGDPRSGLQDAVDNGDVEVDNETRAALTDERRSSPSRRAGGRPRGAAGSSVSGADGGGSPTSLPARSLRRALYSHEVAAATDFAQLDSAYNSALDLLAMEIRQMIGYQVDELHDAIVEAGGDLDDLLEIDASPVHAEVISSRLLQVVDLSVNQAVQEAQSQGITLEAPDTEALRESLAARSAVLDRMITRDVTDAAMRRAIRLTGGALDAVGVAAQVRDELREMSWSGVRDQLGGAVQGAQNAGRGLVFRRDGEDGDVYASEILDTNTCGPCASRDGTQYGSMDEAEQDYPFGGYKDCDGGGRCRGTLVKVYRNETAPVLDSPFGVPA